MTLALFPEPDAPTEPAQPAYTERHMLDLLHQRYGRDHGNGPRYILTEHVRNRTGFAIEYDKPPLRTADALAIDLWASTGSTIHGFEVKVSRSDWLTELKDPTKADPFRAHCDYWWLVVPDASIVRDDLPAGWGLLAGTAALRIRQRAPRNPTPLPIPRAFMAAWLRAAVRTATNRSANA